MRQLYILTVLLILALAAAKAADEKKTAPKFEPTEVQALKLENLQLKQALAYRGAIDAANQFNASTDAVKAQCAQIVKENKWPEDVSCNAAQLGAKLVFSEPEKSINDVGHQVDAPLPASPDKK